MKNATDTSTTATSPGESTESSAENWEISGPAEAWEASGSGVRFKAAAPSGWEAGTHESMSGVRAPAAFDGFRANALVRFEDVPKGTSIDDLAEAVKSDVASLADWKSFAPEGSRGTFDGHSMFRMSGTHTETGTSRMLSTSRIVVLVDGPSGPVAVFFSYTTHPNDTESHNAIEEILGTMTFA